jgi:hypothetical protein
MFFFLRFTPDRLNLTLQLLTLLHLNPNLDPTYQCITDLAVRGAQPSDLPKKTVNESRWEAPVRFGARLCVCGGGFSLLRLFCFGTAGFWLWFCFSDSDEPPRMPRQKERL